MGKNNPRKQSSPEAKKQAAIWCAIAVIAVAVMMLMANPWKHQPATTGAPGQFGHPDPIRRETQSEGKEKGKSSVHVRQSGTESPDHVHR